VSALASGRTVLQPRQRRPVLYRRYAADVASETSVDAGGATQESIAKRRKWHQRPTIRALKRQGAAD
jgi:hypothetical protein